MPAPNKTLTDLRLDDAVIALRAIVPEYGATANAPAEAGSVAYINGSGGETPGIYAHDGSAWTGPIGSGDVATDSIGTDELDLAIAPTWTGAHDFTGGLTANGSAVVTEAGLASGTVTLSSGTATVDTGVAVSTSGFFDVKVRPEAGADIAVSLEDDSGGTGNWLIHVEENSTSVGNPTVGWKLKREG